MNRSFRSPRKIFFCSSLAEKRSKFYLVQILSSLFCNSGFYWIRIRHDCKYFSQLLWYCGSLCSVNERLKYVEIVQSLWNIFGDESFVKSDSDKGSKFLDRIIWNNQSQYTFEYQIAHFRILIRQFKLCEPCILNPIPDQASHWMVWAAVFSAMSTTIVNGLDSGRFFFQS